MGAALADNLRRCGFTVCAWDANQAALDSLQQASAQAETQEETQAGTEEGAQAAAALEIAQSVSDLVHQLPQPRTILLMVNAGSSLDQLIDQLAQQLAPGDILVDCGNSHFADTARRFTRLQQAELEFVGLGVSGGPAGARRGPSMMFGGTLKAWQILEPTLSQLAAQTSWGACVARLGDDGAGHFCKMVHNGIEYGDMQLLAEAYQLLRDAYGLSASQIGDCFDLWQQGPLNSYLTALSASVLHSVDSKSGTPWVDLIADHAGQKGTGRWTVIEALGLGVPVPTIAAAVDARALSDQSRLQATRSSGLNRAALEAELPVDELVSLIGQALLLGRLCAYSQGFQLVSSGSNHYGWRIDPQALAKIWTQGCIIRSHLLDEVITALEIQDVDAENLPPLHHCRPLQDTVTQNHAALTTVVTLAAHYGVPTPAMSASLNWLLSQQSSRSAQNLVQAQRDAFGQHGFTRLDDPTGSQHHGTWSD